MRSVVIVGIVFIMACHCYGQNSAAYEECVDTSNTQFEMNKCASEEATRADTELKVSYRGLLDAIAGDSLAIAKLREAERAWLRYRDAYIEAVYPARDKQSAYGTEYPMNVSLLRAKVTRAHLADIVYLTTEYQPVR